jgi:hypothetical protein
LAKELRRRAKSTLYMYRLGGETYVRPSAPPALLTSLTDHLLVVASDAIKAVASSEEHDPPVSGKDMYRLLAWVLADARGATETLDKALAETVGKRLDRQAQKVRNECASVRSRAVRAREFARKLALEDAALAATLEADLDASREVERGELEMPVGEVYIGFHELESLLAPQAPPAPGYDDDETDELQKRKKRRLDITDFEDFLRAEGIKFPIHMIAQQDRESGAIPPDLGKALGPDATQALWAELEHMHLDSESWWSCGLPLYTRQLLQEKVRDDGYHAEDIEASEARVKEAHEEAARQREEDFSTISALEDEIEELRGQLREAKGREDALHGVIDRCRWG